LATKHLLEKGVAFTVLSFFASAALHFDANKQRRCKCKIIKLKLQSTCHDNTKRIFAKNIADACRRGAFIQTFPGSTHQKDDHGRSAL
jgi:hypothetical protein